MKKSGFTLAEVLITLGIIGVVAALTAPALVQNAGTAKVGPTLAKVVSTLEVANEQMLHDEEGSDLDKICNDNGWIEKVPVYVEKLTKYISGSSYDAELTTPDSFDPVISNYNGKTEVARCYNYVHFYFADNISVLFLKQGSAAYIHEKGSFKGEFCNVMVDINGITKKPNSLGKDIFMFELDRSGQIVPHGSTTFGWLNGGDNFADLYKYTATEGNWGCNEDYVGTGIGCAGSILENNLKVIYQ